MTTTSTGDQLLAAAVQCEDAIPALADWIGEQMGESDSVSVRSSVRGWRELRVHLLPDTWWDAKWSVMLFDAAGMVGRYSCDQTGAAMDDTIRKLLRM